MVELRKTNFIGTVPFKDKPGGEVIGTAKLEKTKSGDIIYHIEVDDATVLLKGFTFGKYSIAEGEESDEG